MVATGVHQQPLRLTRRGRIVVLILFLLMASLASAVLFATASRANDPETRSLAPPAGAATGSG